MKKMLLIFTTTIVVAASVQARGHKKAHAKKSVSALNCNKTTCPDMPHCPMMK